MTLSTYATRTGHTVGCVNRTVQVIADDLAGLACTGRQQEAAALDALESGDVDCFCDQYREDVTEVAPEVEPEPETVAWLTTRAGWGAWVRVTVANTPEADAAAAAFFRRACRYEVGMTDYAASHVDEEHTTALGDAMSAYFYPTCEHGMSAHLCAGPGHYPADH